MQIQKTSLAVCALTLVFGSACGSERNSRQDMSYTEIRENELEAERAEFIQDQQQRLSEVNNEVERLQARLDHEAKFVDADQKAKWSQELFELKRERTDLQAQLDRARTASAEEWEQMYGTLGQATASLEAGVSKLGNEIAGVFRDNDQRQDTSQQAPPALCNIWVPDAEVDVDDENNVVILEVTTKDPGSVATLQKRAGQMAQDTTTYGQPSSAQERRDDQSQPAKPIEVSVKAQNIGDGVRLFFTPREAGDVDFLNEQLSRDAEQIEEGGCQRVASAPR